MYSIKLKIINYNLNFMNTILSVFLIVRKIKAKFKLILSLSFTDYRILLMKKYVTWVLFLLCKDVMQL